MTEQERRLADERIRAEIVSMIDEGAKLRADTAEINQNMRYRLWMLGAAYFGALGVLPRIFA